MSALERIAKSAFYRSLALVYSGRGVPRIVSGERIRFPARWSRYYPEVYEPHTFRFLRNHCRNGGTVLDIGAHIGLFTVLFARLVGSGGRVFSFEPSPATVEVLSETVKINQCHEIVEIQGTAVTESAGSSTFFDTGDSISNANSLVRTARHVADYRVQTVSVDDFVQKNGLRIDCMKVDVEGAELQVLKGAARTISNQAPILSLALHPEALAANGDSLEHVWNVLQGFNMRVFHEEQTVDRTLFCSMSELFDVQCHTG